MPKDDARSQERSSIYLLKKLLRMAKVISADSGESMTEVIEAELTPPLTRRYRRVITKQQSELGGPP